MHFSYNWLKQYIDIDTEPEALSELLVLHSFEVEDLERKDGDWIFDFDILPNRAPDCFSHLGIAREIKALLNIKKDKDITLEKPEIHKLGEPAGEDKIDIKKPALCPRYSFATMTNIEVKESPDWLKERLTSCGLEPINNVVDAANYVMLETGQPLHAFDHDKLAGNKIYIRLAAEGEEIETLDDEKKKLDAETLVIADSEGPVAIAGIKGGKYTGVSEETDRVLLEAASFTPEGIRQSSQRLKIESDASKRFSQNLSPQLTEYGLSRFVELLKDTAGGQFELWQDSYPAKKKQDPRPIIFHIDKAEKLAGVDIDQDKAVNILSELGFEVEKKDKGKLEVLPPFRRTDVSIEEDLIEEIIRVVGFNNLPSRVPKSTLVAPDREETEFWSEKTKDILAGFGYTEVMNFTFIGADQVELFGLDKDGLVELENPLSRQLKYLRPDLGASLVKSLAESLKDQEEIRVFELSKAFRAGPDKTVSESFQLGLACFTEGGQADSFYELKGIIDELTNKLGIKDIYFDDTIDTENFPAYLHQGRRAEIQAGDEEIGFAGEIKPVISDKKEIKKGASIALLDFDKLVELCEGEWSYSPPSKFPTTTRDIAILVDSNVKFVQILNVINSLSVPLVQDVDLFDMYEGDNVPGGKKSLAFHITYASEEKTLTDEEVSAEHKKIEKALEEELNAEVR